MKTFRNYHYNTLYEFINEAEKTPKNKSKKTRRQSEDHTEFTGSQSMDEALNIARNGHDLKLINSRLDNIKTHEAMAIQIEYSVSGGVPDVPEFLTGNPECMVNYNAVPEANNFIHLVLDFWEYFGITIDQFQNRVIAICSIINDLEVNGFRVKLSLIGLSKFNVGFIGLLIDLKDYEQSLGISEIAGTLHPSFLRRIKFMWDEGRSWFKPTKKRSCFDRSYGLAAKSHETKQYLDNILSEDHVLIESLTRIKFDKESLYNKCNDFLNIEGAKAYANHIRKAIEAM